MSNRSVKIVLVGAGYIGREHLDAARESALADYCGVVDVSPQAANALADEFGVSAYTDLAKAIEEQAPDAVDICVPTIYHCDLIEQCSGYGVDVLCEKPIERCVERANQIAEIANHSGIRVMVAQVMRFWPEYRYVKELAEQGQWGEIVSVSCRRLSSPPDWAGWLMNEQASGGAVLDLQIHDMDYVMHLLGCPQAVTTWGREYNGGINACMTQLHYKSGIPVFLETSFLMPKSYPFRMYVSVVFDAGVAEIDFWRDKGQRLMLYPKEGKAYSPELGVSNAYCEEINYFCQRLIDGEPFVRVPLEESIAALQLCLLAEQSARENETVSALV